jgi:hypothetical protein
VDPTLAANEDRSSAAAPSPAAPRQAAALSPAARCAVTSGPAGTAALNLRNLLGKGLTRRGGAWALAT